jgi:hypothetical protein
MTWILPRQLHTLACALDTAALSLDCTEQSEVCAQSLFVRSKPSQSQTWLRKWKRDSWTQHLSGRILRPSLGQRFATEWTSSLGATHASPSVQPGSEKVSKTRGIFGRLLQMVFDFSDPSSAFLKTSKDISRWGCPTSSKTWQEWVIERRGAYSARLNAERRTSESGCSSWPTTAARDHKGESGSGRQERKGHPADTLSNAVAQWPSPVASEVRQGFQDRSRGMKGSQESLTTVVIKHGPPAPASSSTDGSRPGLSQEGRLWMTPKSGACGMTATTSGRPLERATQLTTQVHVVEKQWATPRVHEHMEPPDQWKARNIKKKAENPKLGTLDKPLGTMVAEHQTTSGKLNPRWVETLMGLPVGWTMPSCVSPVTIERTSCDSSAMESFRRQQNEPFEY